jgi:hypothetical protein
LSTLDWGLSFRAAEPDDRGMALVLAAGALAAAALAPFAPWLAPLLPACPFHALTGLPVPRLRNDARRARARARDVAAALDGIRWPRGVRARRRVVPARAVVGRRRTAAARACAGAAAAARLALVAALGANWAWLLVRESDDLRARRPGRRAGSLARWD